MNAHDRIVKQSNIMHDRFILEDGTMKFYFMTSLQNIVTAKIASSLWMNHAIQQKIVILFRNNIAIQLTEFIRSVKFGDEWKEIEFDVRINIPHLYLPDSVASMVAQVVPKVGKCIYNWIRQHDQYILNTRRSSKYSAVDLISNIAWNPRGKIDCVQTAKNILSFSDRYSHTFSLSDDHKYKLSCFYCLDEEIAVLAPNVVNEHFLDSVNIEKHPMVYFWTAHITGDSTRLHKHYQDFIQHFHDNSVNEYILQLLINFTNIKDEFQVDISVPVAYMWGKLSELEKIKILKLFVQFGNYDLSCTLLSELGYEQQQDIFKVCSGTILVDILNDWLLGDYFLPLTLHVLDVMSPQSYLCVISALILHCSKEEASSLHKSFLKILWQKASAPLKKYIIEHDLNSLQSLLCSRLSWKHDLDTIDLIFNDLDATHNGHVVFKYLPCVKGCSEFIRNGEWDVLELFLKRTLFYKEDITQVKKKLISEEGRRIAKTFIEQEAFDKLEHFLTWAFESGREADSFRLSLADIEVYADIKSIIATDGVDFTKLENHLKWCKRGDKRLINSFKLWTFPHLRYTKVLIETLIGREKYELLDEILDWCCLHDKKNIDRFKCDLYKDDPDCLKSLLKRRNIVKKLDKFIDWSFTNEKQVKEFKKWILYPENSDLYCICSQLLRKAEFHQADELIKWCDISPEEESKYKSMLMLSENLMFIMLGFPFWEVEKLQLLVEWFHPSRETVQKLKISRQFRLLPISENYPVLFMKLLEEFVKN